MSCRERGFSEGRMLPDPGTGRAHILRPQTPVTSCHSDPEAWIGTTWAKGRYGGSTHSERAQPTQCLHSSQLHHLSILCFSIERGQSRNAGHDSGDRQRWSESSFHFLRAGSSWESYLMSLYFRFLFSKMGTIIVPTSKAAGGLSHTCKALRLELHPGPGSRGTCTLLTKWMMPPPPPRSCPHARQSCP